MVKVLFVCVHNSARSQMAMTFLNDYGKDLFIAESAGLEKGTLNPYVIKSMAELGYDISKNETNEVFEYYKQGRSYSFVIKVCDEMNGQRCPIFPGALHEEYWNLPDPAAFKGTETEILKQVNDIRDEILKRVQAFIHTHEAFALSRKK